MNNSSETLRLRQILQSPHAAECRSLANHLAFETDLDASMCEDFMEIASAEIRDRAHEPRPVDKIAEGSRHAVH